jgi:hypothetical protein
MKSSRRFKSIAGFVPFLILCFLAACPKTPLVAPVVTPAGPATAALAPVIADNQGKTEEAVKALKGSLSKVSASANVIGDVNATQAPGPATEGIHQEAELQKFIAGPPTAEDDAAALKRKLIIQAGDLTTIKSQYSQADIEAKAQKDRADKAEEAARLSNLAVGDAQKKAAAEQAQLQAKLQKQIDDINAQANARIQAAESGLKKLQLLIFFGGGAFLFVAGMVILVAAVNVPMFGPKAGIALMIAGGGLIALGIVISEVQNFIDAHPWIVGAGIAGVAVLVAIAGALMYSNHQHHLNTLNPAPATPAVPATSSNPPKT